MAIDYSATNQGLGGGTSAGDLQAELNQLLADGGGQSIIQPGDPNTVILDTRNGYDKTIDTVKLTEGYFSGGDGTIEANVISTGSEAASKDDLNLYLNRVKKYSECPFIVGFGINSRLDIIEVNNVADGAVVGSALIKLIGKNSNPSKVVKNYIERLTECKS